MFNFRNSAIITFRNFGVFKKIAITSILANLFEQILLLFAIGYAISLASQNPNEYMAYILIGLAGLSSMSASANEGTYNAFIQMKTDKSYYSILMSPVTVGELVLGHAVWCGLRGVLFPLLLMLVGAMLLGQPLLVLSTLQAIPLFFLVGMLIGFLGIAFTAYATKMDQINLFNFVCIRIFGLFSTVFFLPEQFGKFEIIVRNSPVSYYLEILRNGLPLQGWLIFIPCALVILLIGFKICENSVRKYITT